MAALAAISHDELRFDSVMPYYSIQLEAEALGCKVLIGERKIQCPRLLIISVIKE